MNMNRNFHYEILDHCFHGGSRTPEIEFEFVTLVSSGATTHFHSGSGQPEKATPNYHFSGGFFSTAYLHVIYIYINKQ